LHKAAEDGQIDVCRTLLNAGADVEAVDNVSNVTAPQSQFPNSVSPNKSSTTKVSVAVTLYVRRKKIEIASRVVVFADNEENLR